MENKGERMDEGEGGQKMYALEVKVPKDYIVYKYKIILNPFKNLKYHFVLFVCTMSICLQPKLSKNI